jgi:hypothetical protein
MTAEGQDAAVDWHEIWERKGIAHLDSYDHATLLELDGYDTGVTKIEPEAFVYLAGIVRTRFSLRPGMKLLEVGCGAGALLWPLRGEGLELLGVDYSASLIEHTRRAIPEATFAVAEASSLPFTADAVVVNSVFHYFPDYDYATRVLRALRQAAPLALVLDVPDLATREQSLGERAGLGAKPGRHLYYPRSFFAGAETWTNDLPGYGNAPFRFNCFIDGRTSDLEASGGPI